MSDVKKPVDLVAIRHAAKPNPWLGCSCGRIPHIESCQRPAIGDAIYPKDEAIRDMADELEAWRMLGADLIAGADGAHDGDREASRAAAREVIARMRVLLPPS